ncbi:MAG TPA: N-acetylmuramoyl-L-alanine amidase [Verrucomicrobiales bacterium]|nr:N-acetylmuramoyl-L-alanine amidase [Verrucomicrobiales bacterium]
MAISRFLLLAALFLTLLGMPAKGARPVVVLDPGHGGHDRGATWGGVSEKTVTLSIARRVERHLKVRGFTTAMTRRSDKFRSLDGRAAVANRYKRSVFVSIHCNADPRRKARGIETYYLGARGRRLASSIHRSLDTRTSTPNRGLKCRHFAVLRKTCCPAALVECGFISSASERRLLTTAAYQDRVARAIADGIARSVNG